MVSAWVVRVDLASALAARAAKDSVVVAPDLGAPPAAEMVAAGVVRVAVDGEGLAVMVVAEVVPVVADLAARVAAGLAGLAVGDLAGDAAALEVLRPRRTWRTWS